MQPIVLGPNMPAMFYRGDGRIDRLRGASGHDDRPGDWIASVTARFGSEKGMTRLADGTLLAEAVAAVEGTREEATASIVDGLRRAVARIEPLLPVVLSRGSAPRARAPSDRRVGGLGPAAGRPGGIGGRG